MVDGGLCLKPFYLIVKIVYEKLILLIPTNTNYKIQLVTKNHCNNIMSSQLIESS